MSDLDIENYLGKDPWQAFKNWYEQALKLKVPNPNWMVVSTVNNDSSPDSRVVLLKQYSNHEGFIFFTNYNSQKSLQLLSKAKVSLLFFWDELAYQIRVQGVAKKTSPKISADYFATRDRLSQIGAWASAQSQVLGSRKEFDSKIEDFNAKFENKAVPCPPHWGGWQVIPFRFEFWHGQTARLHNRLVYELVDNKWQIYRLYP